MNGKEKLPCKARFEPYEGSLMANRRGEIVTVTALLYPTDTGAYVVYFSNGAWAASVWGRELRRLTPLETLAELGKKL